MNEVVVVFETSLYLLSGVKRAAERYGSLARIQLATQDGKITATIADINAELADCLVDEFCNEALYQTLSAHRSSHSPGDAGGLS